MEKLSWRLSSLIKLIVQGDGPSDLNRKGKSQPIFSSLQTLLPHVTHSWNQNVICNDM